MRLEALRQGNFASLDVAVQDWSRVITHLQSIEREARTGMRARAERANWEGINATVSREFITNELNQNKTNYAGMIGTGIGVGVSFVGTPVLGALAGGAATTTTSVIIEYISQQSEAEKTKEAFSRVGDIWEVQKATSSKASADCAEIVARKYDVSTPSAMYVLARNSTQSGYSDASSNAARMARDLETDVHR
ncbi:hypothetical protein [Streptomyces sp. NPDC051561]|uniref:hypothetical protein n=1 Tax=Streptomyces sp. NPDC051561 TaxID=3365658 RepID=UPI00378A939C